MAAGLGLSALAVVTLGNNPAFLDWMFRSGGFKILSIGLLIYSLGLQMTMQRLPVAVATAGYFGYAALMGTLLSPIVQIYTQSSLVMTFGVAAGTFGAMAVYGATTKRDLTSMGRVMAMATFGLALAMLANWWFKSSMMTMVTSGIGVVLFTGLAAFDAQRIRRIEASAVTGDTQVRLALLCAMHMYMNLVNLFLFLLRFMGDSRSSNRR